MFKSFILLFGPLVCWPSHCQAVAVTSGITDPFNRNERLYFHFVSRCGIHWWNIMQSCIIRRTVFPLKDCLHVFTIHLILVQHVLALGLSRSSSLWTQEVRFDFWLHLQALTVSVSFYFLWMSLWSSVILSDFLLTSSIFCLTSVSVCNRVGHSCTVDSEAFGSCAYSTSNISAYIWINMIIRILDFK